jgi:dihydroorotate dehydrogenase
MVIAAPFGNYRFFGQPYDDVIMTVGTYTLEKRAGLLKRIWKIVSTVRHYPKLGAWVNKLGLPNPGFNEFALNFMRDCRRYRNAIISIKGFTPYDWSNMANRLYSIMTDRGMALRGVELNVSCPNVEKEKKELGEVFQIVFDALHGICPVIVKLPPVDYMPIFESAYAVGIRAFHCCNTLPVPGGGMSGKPLKPLALEAIRQIREAVKAHEYPCGEAGGTVFVPIEPTTVIIGGGGITEMKDAWDFMAAGADSVSMASGLFKYWGRETAREIAYYMRCRRDGSKGDSSAPQS